MGGKERGRRESDGVQLKELGVSIITIPPSYLADNTINTKGFVVTLYPVPVIALVELAITTLYWRNSSILLVSGTLGRRPELHVTFNTRRIFRS